jgi:hypothetical protein
MRLPIHTPLFFLKKTRGIGGKKAGGEKQTSGCKKKKKKSGRHAEAKYHHVVCHQKVLKKAASKAFFSVHRNSFLLCSNGSHRDLTVKKKKMGALTEAEGRKGRGERNEKLT